MKPLVSVCIPTYNGERYLRECIESSLKQTFDNIEILIVDDASTDETLSIVEEYSRLDSRIRISHNEENLGLVSNWNRCVDLVQGAWIKFLFQDDFLEPQCIEHMLSIRREECPLIVCRRQIVFASDVPDSVKTMYFDYVDKNCIPHKFPDESFITAEKFCQEFLDNPIINWIGEPSATLIHRSAFDRFGLFNPQLASLCDWEFCARVAVNTGLCYVDYGDVSFRVHDRSVSATYRSNGRCRARYIDPLIIQHDIAYEPEYAPVQRLASQRVPPIDLIQRLLYEAKDVRSEAEHYAYDPIEPNPQLLLEWQRAVRHYRRLQSVPISYVLRWGKRRMNSLWQR